MEYATKKDDKSFWRQLLGLQCQYFWAVGLYQAYHEVALHKV